MDAQEREQVRARLENATREYLSRAAEIDQPFSAAYFAAHVKLSTPDAESLLKALVDRGWVHRDAGGWRPGSIVSPDEPSADQL
jgi:hypothetical protein